MKNFKTSQRPRTKTKLTLKSNGGRSNQNVQPHIFVPFLGNIRTDTLGVSTLTSETPRTLVLAARRVRALWRRGVALAAHFQSLPTYRRKCAKLEGGKKLFLNISFLFLNKTM